MYKTLMYNSLSLDSVCAAYHIWHYLRTHNLQVIPKQANFIDTLDYELQHYLMDGLILVGIDVDKQQYIDLLEGWEISGYKNRDDINLSIVSEKQNYQGENMGRFAHFSHSQLSKVAIKYNREISIAFPVNIELSKHTDFPVHINLLYSDAEKGHNYRAGCGLPQAINIETEGYRLFQDKYTSTVVERGRNILWEKVRNDIYT
jgi:hypothetical protein